jgi:solute carrier family 8 (sodium/calcium exchanger)
LEDGKTYIVETPVWNPTIANLTLMALGSSAPEILLSIIEAVKVLGEPAGPLGVFSIVGSGAFNLLVISAVSIVAVDKPKKILDTGVFFVTSTFSIFGYVWLYACLVL